MSPLKAKFVDFWPGMVAAESPLWLTLRSHFDVVLTDNVPDYLIYSVFGPEHTLQRYDGCVKILWTGESLVPDFRRCDYALSFEYLDDSRNLRWPLYVDYMRRAAEQGYSVLPFTTNDGRKVLKEKLAFCDFIYSNSSCKVRSDFFDLLSSYKLVTAGGPFRNNTGYNTSNKRGFQAACKFSIAFENSSHPGYVTEKILDPLLAGSVPIYWGSPRVAEDFDPRCFVNCHDFPDFASVVRRVIEIDQDDELYLAYLTAPRLAPDNRCVSEDYFVSFFEKVFADRTTHTVQGLRGPGSGSWAVWL